MKTLTPYYGGKMNRTGKFIVEILPTHRNYIEPCGGMAAVLMMKPPAFKEVYNDIDGNVVNLFRVVRDPVQCAELVRRLELTPYSREEWKNCAKHFRSMETDPVEWARMVYVVLSQGFVGSLGHNRSWSCCGLAYETSVSRVFYNGIEFIPQIQRRLRNVIIENQDIIPILKRWDHKLSLFYLDPPYLQDTRKTFYDYNVEMKLDKHLEILEWCKNAKSKIIFSGYRSGIYSEQLENAGFIRVEIPAYAVSGSQKEGNNLNRTECLWINYRSKDLLNPLFEPKTATL